MSSDSLPPHEAVVPPSGRSPMSTARPSTPMREPPLPLQLKEGVMLAVGSPREVALLSRFRRTLRNSTTPPTATALTKVVKLASWSLLLASRQQAVEWKAEAARIDRGRRPLRKLPTQAARPQESHRRRRQPRGLPLLATLWNACAAPLAFTLCTHCNCRIPLRPLAQHVRTHCAHPQLRQGRASGNARG